MSSAALLLPKTQGLTTSTFEMPSLDRSSWKSLPQIIDEQAQKNPTHRTFLYSNANDETVAITFQQYARILHSTARRIQSEVAKFAAEPQPIVVAIVAVTDSLTFALLVTSILRAGLVPFNISPQNSPEGVAYLLSGTNARYVYASSDRMTQSLVADAVAILVQKIDVIPRLLDMPTFEEMRVVDEPETSLEPLETPDLDRLALIVHSSGSTSEVAKIMNVTHRMLLEWATVPYYGDRDVCGEIMAAHTIPMQHTLGLFFAIWPATTGMTVAFLRPLVPPLVPTPKAVLDSILVNKCTMVMTVPSFPEAWSKTDEGMTMLVSMKLVSLVGAPLIKDIGDMLAERGVPIQNDFGSMETGPITCMFTSKTRGLDWHYFKLTKQVNVILTPLADDQLGGFEETSDNLFVPTVVDCASQTVVVSNTLVDGVRAFKMNDILQQHPTDPLSYKLYGRMDDQIVLSTGNKINSGPIELYMRRHPKIAFALMFGNGKRNAGILLQLHPAFAFEPRDVSPARLEAYREEFWQTVVDAIQGAQSQSRIPRKMIIFASPSKPFPLTGKNNPRRALVFQMYQKEIEELYEA